MNDQTKSVTSQLQSLMSLLQQLSSLPITQEVKKQQASIMVLVDHIKLNCQIELAFEGAGEKQLLFAADYESKEWMQYAIVGGNRSGKTYAACFMCFAPDIRDNAKDGEVYWCIAPNADKSISGQQKELWSALPRSMFGKQVYDAKNGFGKQSPVVELILPGGRGKCLIRFKAASQYDSNPASFEQEKVAGAWVDETISEGVFDTILPRLVDLNGRILVSTIPDESWMFTRLEEEAKEEGTEVRYEKMCMMDNAHNLPEGAIERCLRTWSKDQIEMRIYGNFRFLQGIVFKEFKKDIKPTGHLFEPGSVDFHSKVEGRMRPWPKWRFLDYGMSHPTWCGWGTVSPSGELDVYTEYISQNETVIHDAINILELSKGELFHSPMIIDCNAMNRVKGNPSSIADQYRQAKLICVPSLKTGKKYPEWDQVQVVKKLFENNKILISTDCKMLIRNLSMWKYKYGKDGKPLGTDAFEDKNNDGIDALRYWIATKPRYKIGGGCMVVSTV